MSKVKTMLRNLKSSRRKEGRGEFVEDGMYGSQETKWMRRRRGRRRRKRGTRKCEGKTGMRWRMRMERMKVWWKLVSLGCQHTFNSACCFTFLSLWLWLLSAFRSTAVEERVLSDTPSGKKAAKVIFSSHDQWLRLSARAIISMNAEVSGTSLTDLIGKGMKNWSTVK